MASEKTQCDELYYWLGFYCAKNQGYWKKKVHFKKKIKANSVAEKAALIWKCYYYYKSALNFNLNHMRKKVYE